MCFLFYTTTTAAATEVNKKERRIESQKLTMKYYNLINEVGRRADGRRKKEQSYKPLGRIICAYIHRYLPLMKTEHVFSLFYVFFFAFFVHCHLFRAYMNSTTPHNIVYEKQQKNLHIRIHSTFARECFINSVVAFNFLVNTVCHNSISSY